MRHFTRDRKENGIEKDKPTRNKKKEEKDQVALARTLDTIIFAQATKKYLISCQTYFRILRIDIQRSIQRHSSR